ncbi:Cytidyltransferase domain protein [Trichostrongylus colubriformis]|uniref:ethanolamine-phosphate cytidylyltransferase n=1 Tax=Trichostrongylus colubriformis TaxID=6319 RepID=A0AAN8FJP2_TRICO
MVHFGDLYQLREAKKLGKSVVVGLHSDGEIMRITGYPPVFNENERYRLLSNAKFVDKVVKNAPYRTSLAVLDRNNCHYCGKNAAANDGVRFDEVRKAGRLVETKSAFEICTKDIIERVLKFHSAIHRGTIVYTCGTFDFFNVGHLAFLEKAKTFGDYLIVGIYTDEDVIHSKGYHPIMTLYERVLSAFAYKVVDEIVIGAPLIITDELIDRFKIDVGFASELNAITGKSKREQ